MQNTADTPLSVSFRDLPPMHVAYVDRQVNLAAGNFSDAIREGFEAVKAWARQQGYDIEALLVIGVPHVVDRQLQGYQCCLQLPEGTPAVSDGLQTQRLAGGKYAVLTIEKESEAIGRALGRFFENYVPEHRLELDGTRPHLEIYTERTLEYHVPIV